MYFMLTVWVYGCYCGDTIKWNSIWSSLDVCIALYLNDHWYEVNSGTKSDD